MTGHASRVAFNRRLDPTGIEGHDLTTGHPYGTQKLAAGPGNSTADISASLPWSARVATRLRDFIGAQSGVVALETALTVTSLIVVCSGLMAASYAIYSGDRMDRAARAAARAIALQDPTSTVSLSDTACAAIRAELDLDDTVDCDDVWTISIGTHLTPTGLLADLKADSSKVPNGQDGEMILVRVGEGQALARREPAA